MNFSTVVNKQHKQQRDKSPVKVSDTVKKMSECSKDYSDRNKLGNTISNRNVKIGKMSESPKHFTHFLFLVPLDVLPVKSYFVFYR
jgi:hypothetical protein